MQQKGKGNRKSIEQMCGASACKEVKSEDGQALVIVKRLEPLRMKGNLQ